MVQKHIIGALFAMMLTGKSSKYKGIWYMSRDFIMLNTTYLFLNRHALPKDLKISPHWM